MVINYIIISTLDFEEAWFYSQQEEGLPPQLYRYSNLCSLFCLIAGCHPTLYLTISWLSLSCSISLLLKNIEIFVMRKLSSMLISSSLRIISSILRGILNSYCIEYYIVLEKPLIYIRHLSGLPVVLSYFTIFVDIFLSLLPCNTLHLFLYRPIPISINDWMVVIIHLFSVRHIYCFSSLFSW